MALIVIVEKDILLITVKYCIVLIMLEVLIRIKRVIESYCKLLNFYW